MTTNTAFPTSTLYMVKPEDAAICPMKSQRETPCDDPSFHCLCTCFAIVATRIAEESHPRTSVTRGRVRIAGRGGTGCGVGARGRDSRPRRRKENRLLAWVPVALALAAAPPAVPAEGTVPELVRRCVDAYGGEPALAKLAASVQEGSVTSLLSPGVRGRVARAYRRPGRLRVEIDFAGRDPEVRVLDGGRGWRYGREAAGSQLDAMILQAARVDLPALLAARRERVKDAGTLEHAGKRLRVLSIEVAPGLVVEAGVDPESGRILRSRGRRADGAGPPIEFVTTYADFREVGGVLVAFHEDNWANGARTGETVLERVEFPKTLPEELFRP